MRKAIFVIFLGLSMLASANLHADDWPMYGQNLSHTFSNKSLIDRSNVSTVSLTPAWVFSTTDVVSASPAVVNGVVYVGSWNGLFYALNADPLQQREKWHFTVDCQYTVIPIPPPCLKPGIPQPDRTRTDGGIITSSAAVVNGIVYFGAGKTLYALDADSGIQLWKQVICGKAIAPEYLTCDDAKDPTRIFSSPAVAFFPDQPGGSVFVGHTADGAQGYRGGIEAFNATTGALRWRFEVDQGQVLGGRGCGSVWSSAAVDTDAGLVFFGTGDCVATTPFQPLYHEAIIALNARTGKLAWFYQPRQTDQCDFDFGASPNLIDLGSFGHFVGLGGKDGTYYLLNEQRGHLVWKKRVVFGGSIGGFFGGAAFDGQHIFSATAVGDPPGFFHCSSDFRDLPLQEPSMHALNLFPLNAAGGSILWERRFNQSFGATSFTFSKTGRSNGVVFSGWLGNPLIRKSPAVNAYDARNGRLLKTFPMPGPVNSTAVPVGKMLFVTSGDSTTGMGGGVTAFTLP
jgi:outer membrane protein assembly factor BamB